MGNTSKCMNREFASMNRPGDGQRARSKSIERAAFDVREVKVPEGAPKTAIVKFCRYTGRRLYPKPEDKSKRVDKAAGP